MPLFYVSIICVAHSTLCALPAPVFDQLQAESKELCEASVWWQSERAGLRDFIVTCSDMRA